MSMQPRLVEVSKIQARARKASGTRADRLGRRARENEAGHPLRPAGRHVHRDVAPERQADEDRTAARLGLDRVGDGLGGPGERERTVRGQAVAGQVRRQAAELLPERIDLGRPLRAGQASSVEEDDRRRSVGRDRAGAVLTRANSDGPPTGQGCPRHVQSDPVTSRRSTA